MRFLFNLMLFVAVLALLMYWFRSYSPPLRRAYQQWRNTWRMLRQARETVRDMQSGRFEPRASEHARQGKVVDVEATQFKVVCPVCNDALSESQTIALRQRTVRCPGSSRVGRECPYYGRTLN